MSWQGWQDYRPPSLSETETTREKRSKPKLACDSALAYQCRLLGLPEPVAEHRFAPPRKWRFDYCWLDRKLALEVQGGLFVEGRHSRGAALLKEHEKLNAAAALGWRVTFTTPSAVTSGETMLWLEPMLRER